MATPNTKPVFPAYAKQSAVSFSSADGTTKKTLVTGADPMSRIDEMWVYTDSAADLTLSFSFKISGTSYQFKKLKIPLGSGTTTAIPLVEAISAMGLEGVMLQSGVIFEVGMEVALASGKVMTIISQVGDYYQ